MSAEELSLNDFLEVAGQVRTSAPAPIENALVIAFSLSDTLNLRTRSGRNGSFELPPLPVGVYRIVAVKRGFLPAAATVIPTKKGHRLVLELPEHVTASVARRKDAWEIRRTLPRDVLRQVEMELGAIDFGSADSGGARFAGRMESMAGYSGTTAERALEKTSVALTSDMGEWGVELRGSRHSVAQIDSLEGPFDPAQKADVHLELRSSASSAYRVTSTRARWSQSPDTMLHARVETHSLAWQGRRSSIAETAAISALRSG